MQSIAYTSSIIHRKNNLKLHNFSLPLSLPSFQKNRRFLFGPNQEICFKSEALVFLLFCCKIAEVRLKRAQYLMFLNKYKNKRRLGKGAYGDVYLVQDEKGQLLALKLISVRMIQNEPHLREYLDGEIECMKTMNSPNIIKLYDVFEDETSIYLVLEYCDGGDLINYQAKLPNRVFNLQKATEVLAEVIIGLEQLHQEGYLHRDIKSQNVLIKNENGKECFKLADFGFSKKKADIGGTILGTEQFMSPQIFSGNQSSFYGFEVDMWAFGVLFYFMLNMEFPFKLNPHWAPQRKQVELKKLADNFSYSKAVSQTKKQMTVNCTPEVQDLFKKMFDLDPDNRITFSDIRRHPVFIKHFPVVAEASKILYSKKFQPSKIVKKSFINHLASKKSDQDEDNIRGTMSVIRKKDKEFPEEKDILQRKKDEIDFLRDNADQFLDLRDILKPHERLMLSYNLLKYYIVLLRSFRDSLNKNDLAQRYPGLKWNEVLTTKQFKEFYKDVDDSLNQASLKLANLYDQCRGCLKDIQEINSRFSAAFGSEVQDKSFDGAFKQSYRKSTIYIFGVLRETLKNKANKKGNKLNYSLSMLVISHAFNNIFNDLENLQIIFHEYFEEKKRPADKIDFTELRDWMSKSKENVLNAIAKNIIKIYFAA